MEHKLKHEPIDWDIVFALMECYGMLRPNAIPTRKKKHKRVARQRAIADCEVDRQ